MRDRVMIFFENEITESSVLSGGGGEKQLKDERQK